jgi:hypothetical protein
VLHAALAFLLVQPGQTPPLPQLPAPVAAATPRAADSTNEEAVAPAPAATAGSYNLGRGVGGYTVAPGLEPASPRLEATGVNIDNYDRRIESRFGTPDPFYEATVRGGAAMAQGRQGGLDGGWTLSAGDGAELYALQLVDTGEGGSLEGAWRDLRAPKARDSGFIALIGREPGRTRLTFFEPGARAPTVVTLEPSLDGSWRGRLQPAEAGAQPRAVVMRRRQP